jgi:ACR3 family arsenite efflux pump ArsB
VRLRISAEVCEKSVEVDIRIVFVLVLLLPLALGVATREGTEERVHQQSANLERRKITMTRPKK